MVHVELCELDVALDNKWYGARSGVDQGADLRSQRMTNKAVEKNIPNKWMPASIITNLFFYEKMQSFFMTETCE